MPEDQRADSRIRGSDKKGLDEGGERTWYRIALRLGCRSVEERKECTSSTEFLRWQKIFEEEITEKSRADWHTAILAYQIYVLPFRFFGGKSNLELEDFLLKFTLEKPAQKKIDSEEEENLKRAREKHMAEASKMQWTSMFGIDPSTGAVEKQTSPGRAMNPIEKEIARQIAERDAAKAEETPAGGPKKGN